jgi:two-component sensor histidine kinase
VEVLEERKATPAKAALAERRLRHRHGRRQPQRLARWTGAQLHSLVTHELLPCRDGREERVRINGPSVMLEANSAQAIAISLHELATNAAKYGSLSAADGDVEIVWSRTIGGQLSLRWTESGGPTIAPPRIAGAAPAL